MKIYNGTSADEQLIAFINENIDKSTFILSSINNPKSIIRYLSDEKQIVGMYVIIEKLYITFLFSEQIDNRAIMMLIKDAQDYEHIGGTVVSDQIELFASEYSIDKDKICDVATLEKSVFNKQAEHDLNVVKLEYSQIDLYINALKDAGVFPNTTAMSVKKIFDSAVIYVALEDEKIISGVTISTGATTNQVITAVFTHPDYRNQKIATTLLTHALIDNNQTNGIFSIFFNDPIAKRIYLNLGFKINDKLLMLTK